MKTSYLRICFKIFSLTLVLSLFIRILFIVLFIPENTKFNLDILTSLYIGLKFDLRISAANTLIFFILHPLIFSLSRWFSLQRTYKIGAVLFSRLWISLYSVIFLFITLCGSIDMIHFEQIEKRLNSSALRFLSNPIVTYEVFSKTYPIFLINTLFFLFCALIFFVLAKFIFLIKNHEIPFETRTKRSLKNISLFALLFFISWGSTRDIPLRWADAYLVKNKFWQTQSLNSTLYFLSSLKNKELNYDLKLILKEKEFIEDFFGISIVNADKNKISLLRQENPVNLGKINSKTNVILIIMESLAYYKTSLLNPLNTTPRLKEMADNGILFNQHYATNMGTARGVYAILSSNPDPFYGRKGTASRNNQLPPPDSAINHLKNHNKFYFLGGSASWAHIRSVISKSIREVKIFEWPNYSSPKTDVWGLSDLHLSMEADKVLKRQEKPFFAVIQFASYHRPYTIPKDHKEFRLNDGIKIEEIKRGGFSSIREYNSLRFSDYSLGYLIDLAKKSGYFDNTLFIITGDHGIPSGSNKDIPKYYKELNMDLFHVPLIFYAPKLIQNKIHTEKVMQTDILPSVVSILSTKKFKLRSFGRNIFNSKNNRSLSFSQNDGQVFLAYKDYILTRDIISKKQIQLYKKDLGSGRFIYEEKFNKKSNSLADAFYELSKFLILNNEK